MIGTGCITQKGTCDACHFARFGNEHVCFFLYIGAKLQITGGKGGTGRCCIQLSRKRKWEAPPRHAAHMVPKAIALPFDGMTLLKVCIKRYVQIASHGKSILRNA